MKTPTRVPVALLIAALCTFVMSQARGQEIDWKSFSPKKATPEELERVYKWLERNSNHGLSKETGSMTDIKSWIMRGNKITTLVYNYGNITRPGLATNDLIWNRLGHGYEFTPLVGAEVVDANGDTVSILDDGMVIPSEGGYSPDGTLKWGWLPKPGFAAPGQPDIAAWSQRAEVGGDLARKPKAWPESWYNPVLGRYVWPAFLGNDATTPDEEVFFVCDDYTNQKYQYYPFPDDSSKRGLGLDLEVRFFQFNNPLAEDIIFLVYRVTNRSPKTLHRVYFGMYGDPHVGGPNDFADDRAFFIPPAGPLADAYPQRARSMVYAWDDEGKGEGGLKTGYFGFKFLESPTNSSNSKDDDDDGLTDESPFNYAGAYIDGVSLPLTTGISDVDKFTAVYGPPKPRWSGDEDGDWRPEKNDVGIDGIPGTGDFGEGNAQPDIGRDRDGNIVSEPNFGIRDVSESDQIGLTSFWALGYGGTNNPKNDNLFWQLISSDSITIDQELFDSPGDNIFLYGSGPFALEPGATQRFSIALLMGENLNDLILNSETSQRILEANYLFAQPPPKPNLRAAAGDRNVTLYWDNAAESAVDPLTDAADFEGYKIYRSEDYTFSDIYKITDANGVPFLGVPLTDENGASAQFDLVNSYRGLHPVEFPGRGVKYNLGSNSGLVHEYADETVTNGKTYYYAVASYDHGFDSLGVQLPPTESQIAITKDPITGLLLFDQNTVVVTPGPLPSGSETAIAGDDFVPQHVAGNSNAVVQTKILDNFAVLNNFSYGINFRNTGTTLVYDVETLTPTTEKVAANDTFYVNLSKKNILDSTFTLKDQSGSLVPPSAYTLDPKAGRIRGSSSGSLAQGSTYEASYQYLPVVASTRINNEDDNPVFDGMRLFVKDAPLGIDSLGSTWVTPEQNTMVVQLTKPIALSSLPFRPAPLDIHVVWNKTDTTANGKWLFPGDTLSNNSRKRVVVCPFRVVNVTDTSSLEVVVNGATSDSIWRPGREVTFVTPKQYSSQLATMVSVIFSYPSSGDSVLPTAGETFEIRSTKPLTAGEQYRFTTTAVQFNAAKASTELDRIYVVPNPYVVYSTVETPGALTNQRGERRLQFRNLPPQCTIRIYTMMGELVDTIEKNDSNSFANWQVLSYEGQRLAYGVYLYHVDVPGVGEKIGRFALIK